MPKVGLDTDRVISKRKGAARISCDYARETVDAMVDKAAEGLVTEMNKEERIEKREELHSDAIRRNYDDISKFYYQQIYDTRCCEESPGLESVKVRPLTPHTPPA